MTSQSKGREFEDEIRRTYEALLESQGIQATVAARVSIKDTHGIKRNFDVMYEFPLAGVNHRVVIECKNWESSVDIGKLGEFYEKFKSIENTIGIFISNSELQSGAKEFADSRRIQVIHPSQLPSLTHIIARQLAKDITKVALPDENALGQPFFLLLEQKDGEVNGVWHASRDENKQVVIPLFISRKDGEQYLYDKQLQDDYVVRGCMPNLVRAIKMQMQMEIRRGREKEARFALLIKPREGKQLFSFDISLDFIEHFLN